MADLIKNMLSTAAGWNNPIGAAAHTLLERMGATRVDGAGHVGAPETIKAVDLITGKAEDYITGKPLEPSTVTQTNSLEWNGTTGTFEQFAAEQARFTSIDLAEIAAGQAMSDAYEQDHRFSEITRKYAEARTEAEMAREDMTPGEWQNVYGDVPGSSTWDLGAVAEGLNVAAEARLEEEDPIDILADVRRQAHIDAGIETDQSQGKDHRDDDEMEL